MYRILAALVLCGGLLLMTPTSADAHGGCGYGGYYGGYRSYGYYPPVNRYYAPAYYGPRYGGYGYGPGIGIGYGRGGYYRGGGSFISFGFAF